RRRHLHRVSLVINTTQPWSTQILEHHASPRAQPLIMRMQTATKFDGRMKPQIQLWEAFKMLARQAGGFALRGGWRGIPFAAASARSRHSVTSCLWVDSIVRGSGLRAYHS